MTESTAVTKVTDTLNGMLIVALPEIKKALPREMSPERLIRIALTTVRMNKDLQVCDFKSIVGCVIQGAALGLELDGVLGHAYMIPYNNSDKKIVEAQFQMGYQGLKELALRHEKVAGVVAEVVREGDTFKYRLGTSPFVEHLPAGDGTGEIIKVYAIVQLVTGFNIVVIWTTAQINKHRDHFSKAKKGPFYQEKSWPGMAKKTVLIQALKWAPLSVEAGRGVNLDELASVGEPQNMGEAVETEFDITKEEQQEIQEEVAASESQDAEFEDVESEPEQEPEPEPEPESPEENKKAPDKRTREGLAEELTDMLEREMRSGKVSEGEFAGVRNWLKEYSPTAIEIRGKIQDWEEALKRRGSSDDR